MNYAAAIEVIKASDLNNSQERAAIRLMNAMKKNTQSSIVGDEPTYDVSIERSAYASSSHASFYCAGEGKIYNTILLVVLGPRGGKTILSANTYSGGSGNKFHFFM